MNNNQHQCDMFVWPQYNAYFNPQLEASNLQNTYRMFPQWPQNKGSDWHTQHAHDQNVYQHPLAAQMLFQGQMHSPVDFHHTDPLLHPAPKSHPASMSLPALTPFPVQQEPGNNTKPTKRGKRTRHINNGFSALPLVYSVSHPEVNINLNEKTQWDQLHAEVNEMFASPNGRDIFPRFSFGFDNVKRGSHYTLSVHLVRTSESAFTYNENWLEVEPVKRETKIKEDVGLKATEIYSPSISGLGLMTERYKFKELKVFTIATKKSSDKKLSESEKKANNDSKSKEMLLVKSGYKYIPVVTLYKLVENYSSRSFVCEKRFPETEFVAVTAYKNERVKLLKSTLNPFVPIETREKAAAALTNLKKEVAETSQDQPQPKPSRSVLKVLPTSETSNDVPSQVMAPGTADFKRSLVGYNGSMPSTSTASSDFQNYGVCMSSGEPTYSNMTQSSGFPY